MKTLPIDVNNVHHSTKKKIERLTKDGFSINRYKRQIYRNGELSIGGCSVAAVVQECNNLGVDLNEAIIDEDSGGYEYGPPILRFPRLETDQEAAYRAIESWEKQQENKRNKEAQKKADLKLLNELKKMYPEEA